MSRNSKKGTHRNTGVIIVLVLMMLVFIAGSALMIKLSLDLANQEVPIRSDSSNTITLPTAPEAETTEAPPETTVPVPEHVVSTATILSTGDILMHKPIIDVNWSNDGYDFESIFRYVTEDVTAADYAVANLETTLASTTNGYQYAGYPNFNCPDEIVDGAKNAGFDMLLKLGSGGSRWSLRCPNRDRPAKPHAAALPGDPVGRGTLRRRNRPPPPPIPCSSCPDNAQQCSGRYQNKKVCKSA